MLPENRKTKNKRKDLTTEFPARYYVAHPEGITRSQVDEVLVQQYDYIVTKVKSGVAIMLDISLGDSQAQEALHEAIAATVERFEKKRTVFVSQAKLVGYLLLSAWREFRNENIRATKRRNSSVDVAETELPLAADAAQETGDTVVLEDYLQSEEFRTFVHERVYDYLDDCILDQVFSLRDVSIFKIYCVNNYSIQRMAEETQFTRTAIVTALSKIKKHLAGVDFRWYQFSLGRVTK